VQVPAATNAAVTPDTVQTLVGEEANVMGNPELAVADKLNVETAVCAEIAPKVIVCAAGFTVKLCVTELAAAYAALPACDAVIVQVPLVKKVAVVPKVMQTFAGDAAYKTDSPELAAAVKVNGVPTVCGAIAPNVIVCVATTLNVCDTDAAAA
jgi:hypothetical protein